MMRKNRLLFMLLALLAGAVFVFGCSDDDDDDPTDPGGGDPGGNDGLGSVSGIIQTANGFPLSGAAISVDGGTTTSNESGYFVISGVDEGAQLVTFTLGGYMTTYRVAQVVEGQTTHYESVVLAQVESATVDGATGGQAATGDGDGVVDFEANSFVDAAGDPYTGDVTVELNALVPDDAEFYGTFPGEFAGVREDGSEVPFVSYGFMTVQLMTDDKAPLQLADGVTAGLQLTISEEKAASAPATIPMWYFDPEDGQWHEEGEATLDGNVYSADVAHFTTWNWDLPIEDICSISGSVVDENGAPVSGARVISQGVDVAIMDEAFTNDAGVFNVRAVRESQTDVYAISGSRASEAVRVSVGTECPFMLEEPLVLQVPAYSISLTWGLSPSDLDSHLYIPMTWDDGYDVYHIAYYNQGTFGEDPYAALDTDDTSSYGPEIITGTRLYEGRFAYWVHNYSMDENESLQNSGAVVQLEATGRQWSFEAIDVPDNAEVDFGWWHVFDMVVAGGVVTIEPVMAFGAEPVGAGIYPSKKASHAK
jgi:hypothetical protein